MISRHVCLIPFPIITDALVRSRHTRTQTRLTAEERWKNVADAFRIKNPEKIRGKHVVLVEDVITTGATVLLNDFQIKYQVLV